MDKWFRDYGFSREVVLEACSRTITAIHNPSFQYADKILTDWKEAGVRGLGDIMELDTRRMAAKRIRPGPGTSAFKRMTQPCPARETVPGKGRLTSSIILNRGTRTMTP